MKKKIGADGTPRKGWEVKIKRGDGSEVNNSPRRMTPRDIVIFMRGNLVRGIGERLIIDVVDEE